MQSRFLLFVSISAWVSLMILLGLYRSEWPPMRQTRGIMKWLKYGEHRGEDYSYQTVVDSGNSNGTSENSDFVDISDTSSRYDVDASNLTYPRTTLVLATMSHTDNTWLTTELQDQLGPASNLYTAIYVNDASSAPLHTPANRGHEAMAYLSYIIDYYTSLPPISIFLHGHPTAWHNNFLLDMSTSQMIRHLNRTKVLNEGYMNLRCQWGTGCPAHLYPMATEYDDEKPEELLIKDAWTELFPMDAVPEVLAQPCCSQFAVTNKRIRRWPLEKYIQSRDWLLETEFTDYMTGRFFEYFWQWILNGTPTYCQDQRICYCEGYGACFEDPDEYVKLFEVVEESDKYKEELRQWKEWSKRKAGERSADIMKRSNTTYANEGPDAAEEGQEARENWLKERVQATSDEISRRKEAAFQTGRDPARRAAAIEAARREPLGVPEGEPPWWYK